MPCFIKLSNHVIEAVPKVPTASNWTDACGIDSGNTTCAVDMYLILRYLMSFDAFVEVSGAPSFTMPAKEKHRSSSVLVSQNAALSKASYYRSAMQGGMCNVTAFKNDTGTQSYVSWGNKDGATYIFCVMDSPDSCDTFGYANRRPALLETVKLMDWVFDSFSIQAALDTDLTIAEIPVTPHIAWTTKEALQRLMDITTGNLRSFLAGKGENIVNP